MLKKILIGAVALAVCSDAVADDGKVVIKNGSKYVIGAVFASPSGLKNWGKDHLGDKVLNPGDKLTLTGVEAGTWDFKLDFAKDGSDDQKTCIIPGVELDDTGDVSEFDNKTLKKCADATEAAAAEAEEDDEEEEE